MAHLLLECVGHTGGPTAVFRDFLVKYTGICRGKSLIIGTALKNRLESTADAVRSTWVPPPPHAKEMDYCLVALIDSIACYASFSDEGWFEVDLLSFQCTLHSRSMLFAAL